MILEGESGSMSRRDGETRIYRSARRDATAVGQIVILVDEVRRYLEVGTGRDGRNTGGSCWNRGEDERLLAGDQGVVTSQQQVAVSKEATATVLQERAGRGGASRGRRVRGYRERNTLGLGE